MGLVILVGSMFVVGAVTCCGGVGWIVHEAKTAAAAEIEKADQLYDAGQQAEAVTIYERTFNLAPFGRRTDIAERIIRHKLTTGDSKGADRFADQLTHVTPDEFRDADVSAVVAAAVERRPAATAAEERKRKQDKLVATGEIGVLHSGSEKVMLATDVAAYDRMMSLAVAGDDLGLAQLALAGKAFLVPDGTRVRVIGRAKVGVTEVRIQEGDAFGASGLVDTTFVRPD